MDILNIIESRLLYHLIPPQTQVRSGWHHHLLVLPSYSFPSPFCEIEMVATHGDYT